MRSPLDEQQRDVVRSAADDTVVAGADVARALGPQLGLDEADRPALQCA